MNRSTGIIVLMMFSLLVSGCSSSDPAKVTGVSPVEDRIAEIVWNDSKYEVTGNRTPKEKVGVELGTIEHIVSESEADEDGEAALLKNDIELSKGTKIFSINGADENTVLAIRVNEVYYSAYLIHLLD